MVRVSDIRKSIDKRVDAWEKSALAFEAQLDAGKAAVADRIEQQKDRVGDALDRAKDALDRSVDTADATKEELRSDLDHVKVQLALGKMETRQAYEEQKKKISDAVGRLEASLDAREAASDRAIEEAIDAWVAEEITLEAELEAAAIQWELERVERKAEWDNKKQEARNKVRAFRRRLEEGRSAGKGKLEAFAGQADEGFEQVKQAFKNLVS
jgi:hypothetical protein